MIIQAALCQCRVVLAGIQHHPVTELAVVQHHASVFVRALVVPVHHHAFRAGILPFLVDVPGHIQHTGCAACQLRILRGQLRRVFQTQAEEIRRSLDILHARLPVEHQQVHAAHGDIPQPAPHLRIPEDAGHSGALLEFAPPAVAVHLLIIRLLQHHRQYAGKRPCRVLIVCRAGQDVRFRVVVHGVGMLVGDAVEQPPAGRLTLAGHHGVGVIFPVPHAEPQFVVHQALVQRRFSGFVPLQGLHGLSHLCFAHRQSFVLKIFHCLSPSCFQLAPLGEQSTPAGVD